jgi:hypothetical protein
MVNRKEFVIFLIGIALAACGVAYLLLQPKERTFENRNMAQWLRILNTDPKNSKNPLRIVRIVQYDGPKACAAELPLSYDLIKQHGFCDGKGKFHLVINGRSFWAGCWRGTNGTCLLPFDKSDLNAGTNQFQVDFLILNPANIDGWLHAEGPITEFSSSNIPP